MTAPEAWLRATWVLFLRGVFCKSGRKDGFGSREESDVTVFLARKRCVHTRKSVEEREMEEIAKSSTCAILLEGLGGSESWELSRWPSARWR